MIVGFICSAQNLSLGPPGIIPSWSKLAKQFKWTETGLISAASLPLGRMNVCFDGKSGHHASRRHFRY
jgi:hypothetical protein